MHKEFINFLATQSITAEEWQKIKLEQPEVAEQELDVFSDLIWEGVLKNVTYLEHFSSDQIHLFHLGAKDMKLIAIKLENKPKLDLLTPEGYNWLRDNLMDNSVTILNAHKPYSKDRNKDKFALIQQGAAITKGSLFDYFDTLISVK